MNWKYNKPKRLWLVGFGSRNVEVGVSNVDRDEELSVLQRYNHRPQRLKPVNLHMAIEDFEFQDEPDRVILVGHCEEVRK